MDVGEEILPVIRDLTKGKSDRIIQLEFTCVLDICLAEFQNEKDCYSSKERSLDHETVTTKRMQNGNFE